MLYYKTIDTKTLELLRKLQNVEEFSSLRLVGGTALALQIGHRKSIDLDLFGIIQTDSLTLTKILNEAGKLTILKSSKNINIVLIDGIKVDIVNYDYKWLSDSITEDGIELANIKDIAAMKLAAITGRGTKKDFIDLFFLLEQYSLHEMLDFYSQKYHDGSIFLVLKSLSYFDDAEQDKEPNMFRSIKWEDIKSFIAETLKEYLKENKHIPPPN